MTILISSSERNRVTFPHAFTMQLKALKNVRFSEFPCAFIFMLSPSAELRNEVDHLLGTSGVTELMNETSGGLTCSM